MNVKSPQPRLILVVEDDLDLAALLRVLLRRAGLEVCHASTAQQGLTLAQECLPAAVVLDIDLPDFSGLELCRRLKTDLRTAHLPVVFCSGNTEARPAALAVGGLDFLAKPHDVAKLPTRVLQALCPPSGPSIASEARV